MPDRELQWRAPASGELVVRDEGQRLVDLRIMPWGIVAATIDGPEAFDRGAFDDIDPTRVTIEAGRHGGPLVGRGVSLTNREDAQYMTARIAPTPAGDELLTLAREGVYQDASVAFYPVAGGHRRRGGATVHSRADLRRVAILERGSYPQAAVLAVRSNDMEDSNVPTLLETPTPDPTPDPTPEPTPPDELSFRNEVRAELGAIRLLAGRQLAAGADDPYAQLRSFADFGMACRAAYVDPAVAALMTRALVDEITGDNPGVVPPGWLSSVAGILPPRQPAVTAFGGRNGLPDAGMDVNWPYYDGDINALVAVQAAQKTALNSVKISFKKGTTPIATYGFAHDVAYQLILRSDPSYIASANRVLVAAFAAREDAQFIAAIVALDQAGSFVTLDALTATADAVRAALFQASLLVEGATGAPASFGLAATNVFAHLGGLTGLVPAPYGTANVTGTADAASLRINVSGLPIYHDARLPANAFLVSNQEAASYLGVGPFFATAEDVERLGRNEAIWGMGAGTIILPKGICWLAATAPTVLTGRKAKDQDAD
jgi:phage head maturation protease